MEQPCTERLAPQHGIAAIARMTEIERAFHFGNVLRDQRRVAAKTVAGEDQSLAADHVPRSIRPRRLDAVNASFSIAEKRGNGRIGHQRHAGLLDRPAQPIDQFAARAARQAMHPARGMAGIIEIIDHGKRQAVAIGKPFDGGAGLHCDQIDDGAIGFTMRFPRNILGKELRRVDNAARLLEPGCRRGDQPGRQRGRAARQRIALEDSHFHAGLVGSKRGAQTCRSAADDQDRNARLKPARRWWLDGHGFVSASISAMVAMPATGFSAAMAV
jgi:hypothetical protein